MFESITQTFTSGATVVDLMAGAHNVSLAAKAMGHTVVANDRMYGPLIIGKGILENQTHTIDIENLSELLVTSNSSFITNNFVDVHLPLALSAIADNIQGNVESIQDDSIWVYRYLLYRFLTHIAPFNMFRYNAFVTQYNEGKKFSKSLQKYADGWDKAIENPLAILQKFAAQINQSIIAGNCTMYNDDLDTFLYRGSMGDILYFDPPYYGARVKYERGYEVIDQMLSMDMNKKFPTSDFNNLKKERELMVKVLTYAKQYEKTVFSYWTKCHDRSWFEELFEEVGLSFKEIPLNGYKYSLSGYIGGTGESSGTIQKKVDNVEILYELQVK